MEWKRKGVHMAAGLLIILLRFLPYWALLCMCLFGILFNLFVLPLLFPSIMRGVTGDRRGVVFYPIAVTALVVLFPHDLAVVAGAWAILSFGDGMATLIGRLGHPMPLRWNPKKTSQGTLACFVFGGWTCFVAMMGVDPGLRENWELWAIASIIAALFAAWIESLPLPINDNLTVPFAAAGVLWATSVIEIDNLVRLNGWFTFVATLANGALAIVLTSFRLVHGSATWAGVVIGPIVWVFGDWDSYLLLICFFVLGTLATKHGYQRKVWRGVAQEDEGRRSARHVVANCGVPAVFAFLVTATPFPLWMKIAVAASLATALFDTLSSELGQVYGRHPVLPTTGEVVPIGTEGAISMEGTLGGLLGAMLFALFGWLLGTYPASAIPIVVLAAFIGSGVESFLGAMVKADFTWKNEILNFTNTAIGGGIGLWIAFFTQPPVWPIP